jgi:hypothetical protein
VQRTLRLPGLAGVVGGQVPAAHQLAEHKDDRHQAQPAEHGGLAVPGTPAGDPFHQGRAGPSAVVRMVLKSVFRQY